VFAVYDITGDYDVAIVTRFKDRSGLNDFVKSLLAAPHVKRTVTNLALNIIKENLQIKLNNAEPRRTRSQTVMMYKVGK
jgi:macrodomain Ter protein organizer (MatP/YcbG family)